jgi:transcriptional regulator with XRE-family HTH domain
MSQANPWPPSANAPSQWQAQLGHAVVNRRRELGLSQEKLAFDSQLDRTYISSVERGRRNPSLLTLARIATALQLPLSGLIARAEAYEDSDA